MELVNNNDGSDYVSVISNSDHDADDDMETLLNNDPEFQARVIAEENRLVEILIETEYAG